MNERIILGAGWYNIEKDNTTEKFFVWSSDENCINILNENVNKIKINFINPPNNVLNFITVKLDDKIVIKFKTEIGNDSIVFLCEGIKIVKILCDTFVPHFSHNNMDFRNLGIRVENIFVEIDNKFVELELDEIQPKIIYPISNKSVEKQAKSFKLLDFQYSKLEYNFNPSIFEFKGKKYIITRNSKNGIDNEEYINYKNFRTSLKLFELTDNYDILKDVPLNIPCEDFMAYEDPRVLIKDNKIHISCNEFNFKTPGNFYQKIIVLDENFKFLKFINPVYDGNGKFYNENIKNHKNWTWFLYENNLHAIIQLNPFTVVEFDEDGNMKNEYIDKNFDFSWKYGICRGGTNPLHFKDEFVGIFHSHLICYEESRVYYAGKYKFNNKPPFKMISVDTEPILFGNLEDEKYNIYKKLIHKVVFPCGSIVENGELVISYGLNDQISCLSTFSL
jgi:predicted GH43/DUF377 family glycosyl hydrolase